VAANIIELNSNPVVHARNLVRGFSGRGVLEGLDIDIRKGEFVALLGRSGSGKSTLLRALAGFDHGVAGSGELKVPGELSVVFQDARLLPWKRALANITLGLDGPNVVPRALQALAEVELSGRERAWPHELSGGEQQRVALARALVRAPELLLADEPFSALDALTRIRMHDLLLRLCERHRPAVLLVTHDVDEAIKLADRIVVLEAGRLASDVHIDSWQRSDPDNRLRNLRTDLLRQMGVCSHDERRKETGRH
jgi:sulfonate transport system ATP-binding protein